MPKLIEVDEGALKRTLETLNAVWSKVENEENGMWYKNIVCRYCFQRHRDYSRIEHLEFCGVPDMVDLSTRLFED